MIIFFNDNNVQYKESHPKEMSWGLKEKKEKTIKSSTEEHLLSGLPYLAVVGMLIQR